MNNARRKTITKIQEQLEDLKNQIEELQCEEQESFDNMPEGLQMSERGEACETAANALQEAFDNMDCVIAALEESIQ